MYLILLKAIRKLSTSLAASLKEITKVNEISTEALKSLYFCYFVIISAPKSWDWSTQDNILLEFKDILLVHRLQDRRPP